MRLAPRSLANKLVLSLTVIVGIFAVALGFINIKTEERQLLDSMIVGADQLSKGITSATWHAMLADHREDAYQVMQTIAAKQGIHRIRIFNPVGRVVFSTRPEQEPSQVDKRAEVCSVCHDAVTPRVEPARNSRVRIYAGPDRRRTLAMVTAIYNEPACSQAACHAHPAEMKVLGVLDLALNLDSVDREVAGMQLRVVWMTVLEVVLIGGFLFGFVQYFLGVPVQRLIEGTKAVSAMDLDKPIDIVHGSQELDTLARSFNAMRERLRLAVAELNQFTQDLESKVEQRTRQLQAANQKLLQSDRLASLGQLAASVAHEINNPISGVVNLSMLMQRILTDNGIPPGREAEFRKHLAQVVSETTRVGRIVSDLLAFSRRSKPQRAMADVNKIVRLTLSLVSHKLALGNVEADLDLAPELPPVPCDSSQIQQAVLNLVLNGAEATQARGSGRLWIATRMGAGAVVLTIRDNGEGIPRENLARIFDPFFTTKPEGKGVGLGLAVTYGIIEAHGGEIEVKSLVGEGTTFTVALPFAPVERPAQDGAVPELGAHKV